MCFASIGTNTLATWPFGKSAASPRPIVMLLSGFGIQRWQLRRGLECSDDLALLSTDLSCGLACSGMRSELLADGNARQNARTGAGRLVAYCTSEVMKASLHAFDPHA